MKKHHREKSIWDKKVTVHASLTERLNFILTKLAIKKGVPKGKLLEEYLFRVDEVLEELEETIKEWGDDFKL